MDVITPRDRSLFFISSLNSFNRFAKGTKAAAYRQFELMNDKPKLPSLFNTPKTSLSPTKLSTLVKTSPRATEPSLHKPLDSKTNQKTPPSIEKKAVRQMLTPPPDTFPRRGAQPSTKVPTKMVITSQKPETSAKSAVLSIKVKSSSSPTPASSRRQLVTPPPTPPLALPVANKPATKPVIMQRQAVVRIDKPALVKQVNTPSLRLRIKSLKAKEAARKPEAAAKTDSAVAEVEGVNMPKGDSAPSVPSVEVLPNVVDTPKSEDVAYGVQMPANDNDGSSSPEIIFATAKHLFAIDELETVLRRRAEALVYSEEREDVPGEVTVGSEQVEASLAPFTKTNTIMCDVARAAIPDIIQQDRSTPEGERTMSVGVSSGIQARMTALFGNAGSSCKPTRLEPSAYVRRLNIPELGEGDQASQDQRIQREVDALRSMKRVGSGSHALIKTRAFGGSSTASYDVVGRPVKISLECIVIVEKSGKKRATV